MEAPSEEKVKIATKKTAAPKEKIVSDKIENKEKATTPKVKATPKPKTPKS